MALQSQMSRPGADRRYMNSTRGAGRGRRLVAVVAVLGGIVAMSWYMIHQSGGEPAPARATGAVSPSSLAAVGSTRPSSAPAQQVFAATPAPTPVPARPETTPVQNTETLPPPAETVPPETAPVAAPASNSAPTVAQKIVEGRRLIQQDKLVAGRKLLNEALHSDIGPTDAVMVRGEIAAVNEKLVFSPLVEADDPYSTVHVVQPGEYISNVAPMYDVGWQFILKINNISDARRVPAHARLKIVKGPFNVIVDKSDFRTDVYMGSGSRDQWMFVRSFPVGLGTFDSTPEGVFVVRRHSKLANPEWTNPRTGQIYRSGDPDNPIGEHWIGLRGADQATSQMLGYGLHGTIEPRTIGTEASMGCVRLLPADIELLFGMVIEEKSQVIIQP